MDEEDDHNDSNGNNNSTDNEFPPELSFIYPNILQLPSSFGVYVRNDGTQLFIPSVKSRNAGTYRCLAKLQRGTESASLLPMSSFKVIVEGTSLFVVQHRLIHLLSNRVKPQFYLLNFGTAVYKRNSCQLLTEDGRGALSDASKFFRLSKP
ncbi:hypothetical protein FGIG_02829 [Fasciola gigantica]|uniref:Ig-like domain-containing protein n=1 Tax=Fasciola gigantica TaxID=46835 RepID=A0A504YPP8_FASGI|nr:hypothetical protein FGIG_02829 [Fasciola gigantica]